MDKHILEKILSDQFIHKNHKSSGSLHHIGEFGGEFNSRTEIIWNPYYSIELKTMWSYMATSTFKSRLITAA